MLFKVGTVKVSCLLYEDYFLSTQSIDIVLGEEYSTYFLPNRRTMEIPTYLLPLVSPLVQFCWTEFPWIKWMVCFINKYKYNKTEDVVWIRNNG